MATAAAASAAELEADPKAGPEAEGEEDEAKADGTRRKVFTRAVATATYKSMGPAWDQHQQREEGVSESDGDEEFAMASSAESSPGDDEWEYDEEEEKTQLEIERLEEQVRSGAGSGVPLSPGSQASPSSRARSGSEAAGSANPLFAAVAPGVWGARLGLLPHCVPTTTQGGGSVLPDLPRKRRLSVGGTLWLKVTLPAGGESGLALATDSTPPTPNHAGKLCPAADMRFSSPES